MSRLTYDAAGLELTGGDFQGVVRADSAAHPPPAPGIRLQRAQRVGDILQGARPPRYCAVAWSRSSKAGALGAQFPAMKQRLHQRAADIPGGGPGAEQV